MNIAYDQTVDALYIRLTTKQVVRSQRINTQVALDFDTDGALVGIEVLDVQRTGINPHELALQFSAPTTATQMPSAEEMRQGRAERMRALKQQREQSSS